MSGKETICPCGSNEVTQEVSELPPHVDGWAHYEPTGQWTCDRCGRELRSPRDRQARPSRDR